MGGFTSSSSSAAAAVHRAGVGLPAGGSSAIAAGSCNGSGSVLRAAGAATVPEPVANSKSGSTPKMYRAIAASVASAATGRGAGCLLGSWWVEKRGLCGIESLAAACVAPHGLFRNHAAHGLFATGSRPRKHDAIAPHSSGAWLLARPGATHQRRGAACRRGDGRQAHRARHRRPWSRRRRGDGAPAPAPDIRGRHLPRPTLPLPPTTAPCTAATARTRLAAHPSHTRPCVRRSWRRSKRRPRC